MRKTRRKIRDLTNRQRMRRRLAIRKRVVGTTERPRLCIIKSNKHLVVQVIDDQLGKTLFSVQTYGKKTLKNTDNNKEGAKKMGDEVARILKKDKIDRAVCDRAGGKYHGVIAALVQSVREQGIQI